MFDPGQCFLMVWGKIRRAWLIAFRKDKVREKLALRRGACSRCGACCKILFNCPAYDDSDGNPKCLIYNDRPGVCGLFPLDPADLRERDLVMRGTRCGYYFVDKLAEHISPVRWGPTREAGAKADVPNGTLMILKSFFKKPG
jgi:hypothetical protein